MSETIRPYRAEDAIAVSEVHVRAFDGREEEARLVELLHDAGAAPVSLVAAAEADGRVVGHVLFSPVQIDRARARPHHRRTIPALLSRPRGVRGGGTTDRFKARG